MFDTVGGAGVHILDCNINTQMLTNRIPEMYDYILEKHCMFLWLGHTWFIKRLHKPIKTKYGAHPGQ